MKLEFISTIAIITPEPAERRRLFMDTLGLPLEPAAPGDEYHYSD